MNILIFMMSLVFAAPTSDAQKTSDAQERQQDATKKSTDMNFDELLIQGKYHFTDEAVTTVEQDKVLDGLLEVRKDFKDRIQQSTTRY
jgi:RNase H-fold protein (predicted Holliday junction resolvase)